MGHNRNASRIKMEQNREENRMCQRWKGSIVFCET